MVSRSMRLAVVAASAFACTAFIPSLATAQSKNFSKGDRVLSVGFMTGGDYDGSGVGVQAEFGVLPIGKATLGIGGFVGYQHNSKSAGVFKSTTTAVPFMVISNLHIPIESQPNLDLYGGVSIGFLHTSSEVEGLGAVGGKSSDTDSGFGVQVGARYWLTSKLGVNAQLGFSDIPLIQAGVSIKF